MKDNCVHLEKLKWKPFILTWITLSDVLTWMT